MPQTGSPEVAVQPQGFGATGRAEGDSTLHGLVGHTWQKKQCRLERTEVRVRVQGGVGQGAGQGLAWGWERVTGGAGTVLVCDRLLRPLLMEAVLLDYVEVPEDGCFLKLTDMS